MSGFAGMDMVAVDSSGRPDPQSQLFRNTAVGVEEGPFVSQVQCISLFRVGECVKKSSVKLSSAHDLAKVPFRNSKFDCSLGVPCPVITLS